ncbi:hypothetical protein ABK040_016190 [Willaertia magna]
MKRNKPSSSENRYIPKPQTKQKRKEQENNEDLTVQVDSRDVIKLILQFCLENQLTSTFQSLTKETGISCNTLPENLRKNLLFSIEQGNWGNVLEIIQNNYLTFPKHLLIKLYEHVIFECCEIHEINLANFLIENLQILKDLKEEEPSRYNKIKYIIDNYKHFDGQIAFNGKNKFEIRKEIKILFQQEILNIPSNQLLNIIGMSINQFYKTFNNSSSFHLLDHTLKNFTKNKKRKVVEEVEEQITEQQDETNEKVKEEEEMNEMILFNNPHKIIKFGKKSHATFCKFILDYIILGTSDGFIEVYDENGKLHKELIYQQNDELMLHEDSITCLDVKLQQQQSILLASGSLDKSIKIWNLLTGKCLLTINVANTIQCIYFSKFDNTLYSGYSNGAIKVHGLTSGGVELKEFHGHTSFVNNILQLEDDGNSIISCSGDGSVRIWNTKTLRCEQMLTISTMLLKKKNNLDGGEEEEDKEINNYHMIDLAIHQIELYPTIKNHLIVCYPSNIILVINLETGKEIFRFISTKEEDMFLYFAISKMNNEYLYAITKTNKCYVFHLPTELPSIGTEITALRIVENLHKKSLVGIYHHDNENLIATIGLDNCQLWK